MNILEVRHLNKHYQTFDLSDVSFSLRAGTIMGFIGRNGAGKTTTLKCIYNLIEATSGEILFEGQPIVGQEIIAKNQIGFLLEGIEYYPYQKLRVLTSVSRRFYKSWDQKTYDFYVKEFGLDENKRIKELSNGMKVKYGLAIALSHGAKLLLLDEPTSGLDPVSRDELLDAFSSIVADGNHAILFSTHVISDLEKCADDITYIQNGRILASESVREFEDAYCFVSGDEKTLEGIDRARLGYIRIHNGRFESVVKSDAQIDLAGAEKRKATLEEIMVFLERGIEK